MFLSYFFNEAKSEVKVKDVYTLPFAHYALWDLGRAWFTAYTSACEPDKVNLLRLIRPDTTIARTVVDRILCLVDNQDGKEALEVQSALFAAALMGNHLVEIYEVLKRLEAPKDE